MGGWPAPVNLSRVKIVLERQRRQKQPRSRLVSRFSLSHPPDPISPHNPIYASFMFLNVLLQWKRKTITYNLLQPLKSFFKMKPEKGDVTASTAVSGWSLLPSLARWQPPEPRGGKPAGHQLCHTATKVARVTKWHSFAILQAYTEEELNLSPSLGKGSSISSDNKKYCNSQWRPRFIAFHISSWQCCIKRMAALNFCFFTRTNPAILKHYELNLELVLK